MFWEQTDAGVVEHAQGALPCQPYPWQPLSYAAVYGSGRLRVQTDMEYITDEARLGYAGLTFHKTIAPGEKAALDKIICVATDRDYAADDLADTAKRFVRGSAKLGYEGLKALHTAAWAAKWERADVTIEGDEAAQQGIRFNLFHLLSTYTGEDARLNIGPQGVYRGKVWRRHLLGYRSVLLSGLHGSCRAGGGQAAVALSP